MAVQVIQPLKERKAASTIKNTVKILIGDLQHIAADYKEKSGQTRRYPDLAKKTTIDFLESMAQLLYESLSLNQPTLLTKPMDLQHCTNTKCKMEGSCQTFCSLDEDTSKVVLAKVCICGCYGAQHYNPAHHVKQQSNPSASGEAQHVWVLDSLTANSFIYTVCLQSFSSAAEPKPANGPAEKICQDSQTKKTVFSEAARDRKQKMNEDASQKFAKGTGGFNPAVKV
ncbi:hypothetical protein FRC03_006153 [Tulasnella sp. 419]|nr:hypothetical protein FRC03_006153 [Tulasnella sp. 419]